MHAQSREALDIKSSSRGALLGRLHQTSGVRESRVRGGAAIWPSLAAVAACGGVRECNFAARLEREAWADAPAIGIAVPVNKRVLQCVVIGKILLLLGTRLTYRRTSGLRASHRVSCRLPGP